MKKTAIVLAVALICAIPLLLGGDGPDADRVGSSGSTEAPDDATSGVVAPFRSTNWKQAAPAPEEVARDGESLLDDHARKRAEVEAEALDKKRRATARRLDGVEIAFTAPATEKSEKDSKGSKR